MTWWDDLQKLLTNTEVDPDPLSDIAQSGPGQFGINVLQSGAAQAFFAVADAPRSAVFGLLGEAGNVATGRGLVPFPQAQAATGHKIHDIQYANLPGPLGYAKTPIELGLNLGLDPVSYIGVGQAAKAARGLEAGARLASEAGRPLISRGLQTGATLARGSDVIWGGRIGEAALHGGTVPPGIRTMGRDIPFPLAGREFGIQPGVRKLAGGVRAIRPTALDLAPQYVERAHNDAIDSYVAELQSAPGRTGPHIPSISETAAPPAPVHPHPGGSAPAAAYQGGIRGWLALHHPRLGIIPQSQGGSYWRDPSKVVLEPQHLQAMAEIGVAAMQSVTDEGGLFNALQRGSRGAALMRGNIAKQFGPGIEPWIPLIEDEMRRQMETQGLNPDVMMPASRQFLPHGWAKAMMGTRRLESANAALRGGADRAEVLRQLERYPKTNPQVVEAAAAHGTAALSLLHQGPEETLYKEFHPGGAYFPEGTESAKANARVLIPKPFTADVWGGTGPLQMDIKDAEHVLGVTQPFGTLREAWNQHMLSEFPGLQPEELDTLANMATDQLFHLYMNAAHTYSGGARGAERILRGYAAEKLPQGEFREAFLSKKTLEPVEAAAKVARTKGGQVQGVMPNATKLIAIWREGLTKGIGFPQGLARDLYPRAVRELQAVVGTGNYEDAQILLHAMAVTSTASDVEFGTEQALRILAEWKFGHDETLQKLHGINARTFDTISKAGLLRADFKRQQQHPITKMLNAFAQLREGELPITASVHGGAKTHPYAGQMLAPLWRQAFASAAGDSAIGQRARAAFDRALAVFAYDRHHARIDRGATGVDAITALVGSERGVLASRAAQLSPEEAHAAGWIWTRNEQGLISELRPDGDTATALRLAIQKTWDHDPSAGESWAQVVERIKAEQGITDDTTAWDAAYDASRQEIFHRALKFTLSKPEVQAALRKAGYSPTMDALQGDVFGIISGSAHGYAPADWPQPLRNVVGADGLNARLQASPPGQVLRHDPATGTWEPIAEPLFAVPIATGKSFRAGQARTAEKSITDLLTRPVVADLFDPSGGVDNSARLGLGMVADGEEMRPALFALTADEATATAGAARSDLQRVMRLGTGEEITVPAGRPNRHLPGLVTDIAGAPTPLPRPSLSDAVTRGVTMSEMDTGNFFSTLQRKVVNPLLDGLAQVSAKEGTEQITGTDLGNIMDPGFPDRAASAPIPGDYRLSSNANALAATTLKDGQTYDTFFHITAKAARQDMATLQSSGVTWRVYAPLEERIAAAGGDAQVEKIIRDWHAKGIDLLHAGRPEIAAREALKRQVAKDAGRKIERPTNWDLFTGAWGEIALLSPKYLLGNLQGNWIANALSGVKTSLSWNEYANAFLANRGGIEDVTRAEARESMKATQIARKWGDLEPPQETMRGGIRGITSSSTRITPSSTGEAVARLTRNPELGVKVGWLFTLQNDLASAVDTVGRDAVWMDRLDQEMVKRVGVFEDNVRRAGAGIPGFEFSIADGINVPDGGLFAQPLKYQLVEAGIPVEKAETLVSQYTEIHAAAKRAALEEMNRVQFSYARTNMDQFVAKFVPFHYWMSRALRYYGEEAIRHPYLALNYMRLTDGMEHAEQTPGASARQVGFLKLMATPLGFSLLMNPDALLGVSKILTLQDSYEADGQTTAGAAITWMKDRGFGLYPWIDSSLNLMGIYGNTFEPDLLGIRHKALVGAAVNFLRAHAGFEPANAPYADAMGQVRYAVSSFVSAFTPDWFAQPVTPRPGGSSQEASLDTIIEAQILANNPNLTNQQLLDIMTDPDRPEYKQAFQQTADAGIVQQLLNFTLPESFRMRSDKKDVLAAEQGTIYDAAKAAGVPPWEFSPTQADFTFRAKYKAQTGHEWHPTDYNRANTQYDLIRAPLEAKPFILDDAAYKSLGSPKEQRAMTIYQGLRFGTDPRTAGLPDQARKEIALDWADRHHAHAAIDNTYQLQNAFKASHPEFQEFKQWQSRVRDLAPQYGGTLAEYRRRASAQNPNAARYFVDTTAFIQRTYPQEEWAARLEEATTSAGAFNAITGKGTNRMSPGPFPGVPPVDYSLPTMEPAAQPQAPYQPTTNWIAQLNQLGNAPVSPVRFPG